MATCIVAPHLFLTTFRISWSACHVFPFTSSCALKTIGTLETTTADIYTPLLTYSLFKADLGPLKIETRTMTHLDPPKIETASPVCKAVTSWTIKKHLGRHDHTAIACSSHVICVRVIFSFFLAYIGPCNRAVRKGRTKLNNTPCAWRRNFFCTLI